MHVILLQIMMQIRLLRIKRAHNLVQNDPRLKNMHVSAAAELIQNWQEAFNLHNE